METAMIRDIVKVGDPILTRRLLPVNKFGSDLCLVAEDLIDTCIAAKGLGLAAPQIGRSERMVVMLSDPAFAQGKGTVSSAHFRIVINPTLLSSTGEINVAEEGCLSIPGYVGL